MTSVSATIAPTSVSIRLRQSGLLRPSQRMKRSRTEVEKVTLKTGDEEITVAVRPTKTGGPADRAKLDQPYQVRFDGAGNLFVVDSGNDRIRVVDSETSAFASDYLNIIRRHLLVE